MVEIAFNAADPSSWPEIVRAYKWFLDMLYNEFGAEHVTSQIFSSLKGRHDELGVIVHNGYPRDHKKHKSLAFMPERRIDGEYSLNKTTDKIKTAEKAIEQLRGHVFPNGVPKKKAAGSD
jgi:hypothetical protein